MKNGNKKVLSLAAKRGSFRPCDVERLGVSRQVVYQLAREGKLLRTARGVYSHPDFSPTEHHSLAQVCGRIPKGVVCLLSALQFHDLTTQLPHEVWLTIRRGIRNPRIDLPVRMVRSSGKALTEGVEEHVVEGIRIKVYCPAKTIVDCFKYRNKIGLDVAIEAMKDGRRKRACTNDQLWRYAKICRVANVIRPYMEAIS
jgi:predicted transcriptional regulator of viral defense system